MNGKKACAGNRGVPKKAKVLIVVSALLLAAVLALLLFFSWRNTLPHIVLRVNEVEVTQEEFEFFLKNNRLRIEDAVRKKYGFQPQDDFGTVQWEGRTGEQLLNETCKEWLVSRKLQQRLAEEHGAAEPFVFSNLKIETEQKNEENRKKIEKGEPIYGLATYDIEKYYSYTYDNAILRLKQILFEEQLKASQEEVEAYYQSNKEQLYAKSDTYTFLYWHTDKNEENRKRLQQIKDNGAMPQDEGNNYYGIIPEQKTVDDTTFREFAKPNEELANLLSTLQKGEFSDVTEQNSQYVLLYCSAREDGGFLELQEIWQNAADAVSETKYQKLLEQLTNSAQVWTDETYFR